MITIRKNESASVIAEYSEDSNSVVVAGSSRMVVERYNDYHGGFKYVLTLYDPARIATRRIEFSPDELLQVVRATHMLVRENDADHS